jgi:hypothetical protein
MELSGDLMDIDRPLSGEHLTDGCKSAAGAMAPEPELQLDIPYDSRQDAPLMQFPIVARTLAHHSRKPAK